MTVLEFKSKKNLAQREEEIWHSVRFSDSSSKEFIFTSLRLPFIGNRVLHTKVSAMIPRAKYLFKFVGKLKA